jgi:hypothetical protein
MQHSQAEADDSVPVFAKVYAERFTSTCLSDVRLGRRGVLFSCFAVYMIKSVAS